MQFFIYICKVFIGLVTMKKIIRSIPIGLLSGLSTLLVTYVLLSPPTLVSSGWLAWLHFPYSDKLEHFILFFILCFSYLFDYVKYRNPHHTTVNKELAFTVLASSVGLLTETAQLVMGLGRTFEVLDIVVDTLGAFTAFSYMHWRGGHVLRKYYLSHKRHRHHHHHH